MTKEFTVTNDRLWWQRPFRTFQTNLREIDAGLDVDLQLDVIEAYGANVWLLSTAGIIANYPSALECQTPNPRLAQRESGDLIGDAVRAAKARGIRVLGRMDFSKVDARRAEAHPEWCFVDVNGDRQVYNGYSSVCPSGDYYQREMFDVISEVLGSYELSGFFLNMMLFNEFDYSRRYWGVCQCQACQNRFAEFAPGEQLPKEKTDPSYPTWRRFTTEVLEDLNARLRAHVRKLNPEAALIQGDRADVTFHEANNAVGRELWHHSTAESVSAARSTDPDRPVLVNSVGFVDMPYRWAGEDPNHFAQFLLQTMANGGQPSTYVMGTVDDSPYQALGLASEIIQFHRDHEDLYDGLHSKAAVALVRGGSGDATRRTAELRGYYQSLVEHHVPFDAVRFDKLASVPAGRYGVFILPDVGTLDAEQVAFLQGELERGAAVLATGSSAWANGVSQLGGADFATQLAQYSSVESTRALHLNLAGTEAADLAPAVGGFAVVRPGERAVTDWLASGRSLYGPPEKCYGHEPTGHPGWIQGSVGAGTLAIAPWLPGLVYHEIGLSRVRDAWVGKVLDLGAPQVSADLSEQLQIVYGQAGDVTVLHVLNRSGDRRQRFMEPTTLQGGRVCLPAQGASAVVRARVCGEQIPSTVDGDVLTFEMPAVGRFEVLSIEWTAAD